MMKTALTCLLIFCTLPILLTWLGLYFRQQQLGVINNRHPRKQYLELRGAGARCVAAQQNSWEALIIFIAAIAAVSLSGLEVARFENLYIAILVLRVLYIAAYLANWDKPRSIIFAFGYVSCLYLIFISVQHLAL